MKDQSLLTHIAVLIPISVFALILFSKFNKRANKTAVKMIEEQEILFSEKLDLEMQKRRPQPVRDEYQDPIHRCRVSVFKLASEIVACKYMNEMISLGYEIETIEADFVNEVDREFLSNYLKMLYDVHEAETERLMESKLK